MAAESTLPDREAKIQLVPNSMGRTSFDVLYGPLERDVRRWGKQNMEMIRHQHESVELEGVFTTIVQ